MSAAHALYAPSSMAQTMQCSASVRLQQLYPEQADESSIEGEAAHWACAELLHGRPIDVGLLAPVAGGSMALDTDMIDAAELYASVVRPDLPGLHVESRVQMPRIHPQCWGTPDAWRVTHPTLSTINVWDFKYGHEYVDEFENAQLAAYVAGIVNALGVDGLQELDYVVHATIVQPRCYGRKPVRTWRTTVGELRALWNIMHAACAEADTSPVTRIGPNCKHCTARHACDALQRASLSAIDVAGQAEPLELQTPAAAAELRRLRYAIETMQARASGLEQQLMNTARLGQPVPGFHIETSAGREQWNVPLDKVLALGAMYGADLRKPSTLTPAQARAAGVTTDGFTERRGGSASLVVDQPHQMVRIFKATQ